MHHLWLFCTVLGCVTLVTTLLLVLAIAWCSYVQPRLDRRRDVRRAVDRMIAESRFYLSHT